MVQNTTQGARRREYGMVINRRENMSNESVSVSRDPDVDRYYEPRCSPPIGRR